jgi:hypothetical protein
MPEFNTGEHAQKDPGGKLSLFYGIEKITAKRDPANQNKEPAGWLNPCVMVGQVKNHGKGK